MAFRFRHAGVRMLAAEQDFETGRADRSAPARSSCPTRTGPRWSRRSTELGLSGLGHRDVPDVPTHELDVPRIGYIHSWQRTQDEGWVRGALDHYGVPYTTSPTRRLTEGNLRDRYDVIIYPHVGGSAQSQVERHRHDRASCRCPTGGATATPNLGALDESDDIRGGMGFEGLVELARVRAGGRHADRRRLDLVDLPRVRRHARGERRGARRADRARLGPPGDHRRPDESASPTATTGDQLPVYFKGDLVLSAGGGGRSPGSSEAAARAPGRTPRPWRTGPSCRRTRSPSRPRAEGAGRGGRDAAQFRAMAQAMGFGQEEGDGPRVVMRVPRATPTGCCCPARSAAVRRWQNRAQVVDVPLGEGHVVMFAIRPFWRWQTQGNVLPGLQRDPELERPGRRAGRRGGRDRARERGVVEGDGSGPPGWRSPPRGGCARGWT